MFKKLILLITVTVLAVLPVFSFEVTPEVQFSYDLNNEAMPLSNYTAVELDHTYAIFSMFWKISICNDYKYAAFDYKYFGYYVNMEQGGINLDYEPFELTFGRTALSDEVDSPYSLFVSSQLSSALLADFSYDDGTFFYTTRWTELNRDSSLGYPDRGWQYNTYGIHLGNFSFGFQDSSIYTGRSFDPEFFLNPLPGYFKQMVLTSYGNPWTSGSNANSIIGLFVDYNKDYLYSYAQLLIDDFTNIFGFFNEEAYHNPNKIAWSLGGDYDFDFGKIGFYHAGATKYTFQAYGTASSDTKYGYTFYPDVTYTANDVLMPIELEDNYLGYCNGENNISFLASYEGTVEKIGLYAQIEFELSGDKSPANPWDQYDWFTEDGDTITKLLDSDTLEKKLVLTAGASRHLSEFGLDNLTMSAALEFGYIWNVLELVDSPDDYTQIQYWSPSDENELVLSLTIGGKYTFK